MRIAMLDLETTNLSANVGRIIAACVKPLEGPITAFSQEGYRGYQKTLWDDTPLVEDLEAHLRGYHLLVTYYGRFFDIPFLRSRLTKVPSHKPKRYWSLDLHLTAKNMLKLSSNRLIALQGFLGLSEEKTGLDPDVWAKAGAGNVRATRTVAHHCRQDVKVLELAYTRLLDYVKPPVEVYV